MDKEESLRLQAAGHEAWNSWATELLAQRRLLEEAGNWKLNGAGDGANDETRSWLRKACATFSGHTFRPKASFANFLFPGKVTFASAVFEGDAIFAEARFNAQAFYDSTTFHQTAFFKDATFSDIAWFSDAQFYGWSYFDGAIFEGQGAFPASLFTSTASFRGGRFHSRVNFESAEFQNDCTFVGRNFGGPAEFSRTIFKNEVSFHWAVFSGAAEFEMATFHDVTAFDHAIFASGADFSRVKFESYVSFNEAHFRNIAHFDAAEGSRAFSLAEATFHDVPDFIQAHFAEAPRLDNIVIKPPRGRISSFSDLKARFTGNPDLAARWRALKRLAAQGHDHLREQDFFKNELRARRWTDDRPWHSVFWFGLLYQGLSDFGRSIIRPLLWWLATVAGFSVYYLGKYLVEGRGPTSNFDWLWAIGVWLKESGLSPRVIDFPALAHVGAPSLSCVAGSGEPWWAAVELSLRKGLLFLGLGSGEKINQLYACLFGIYSTGDAQVGRLPPSFTPIIPGDVSVIGLLQQLISAVLIFLFLLAIRNHFRIK